MADVDITSLSVEISAESQGAELNIDKLTTAISNLRTKGSIGKVCTSLDKLSSSIAALKQASAGISGLDKVTNFLNGISSVNTTAGVKGVNSVVNAIKKIPNAVSALNGVDFYSMSGSITQLTNALAPLSILDISGLKSLGSAFKAIGTVPDLTDKLKAADLDSFADSCQKISTALTPLASQLETVGNAFAKLPPQLSKVVTQANRVTAANERQKKSYMSLSSQMNSFMRNMAKLVSLKAIADYLGNAVAKFNDFYEAANMFGVSMGDMTNEASGFIDKMEQLLGIDPSEAMNAMANIYSMTKSFGLAKEQAYTLSKSLTQLGYDLSSLKNIPISQAFTKIRSAMAGELEPMLQLGVDISQARLQQELLALGFNKQVSTLSQADKATLRYIAILKQTTDAQGDFARTLSSPSNMIRVLKAQLSGLARDIGSLLYPALKSILPPLIAAVELIREFVQWVAKLMGVKVEFPDVSSASDAVSGVTDAIDDTTKATGKAAKAFKNYIMGFDELNVIQKNADSSGSSGSGSGAAGNILGDVDLSGYDMFKQYNEEFAKQIDSLKQKIKGMLPVIGAVTAALALWRLTTFIIDLADAIKKIGILKGMVAGGILIGIGFFLMFDGIKKAIEDKLNAINFAEILVGAITFVGGAALLGAKIAEFIMTSFADSSVAQAIAAAGGKMGGALIGAAVAGVVAGVAMFVTGVYDAITNGLNILNGLLIPAGSTMAGAAVGAIIGSLGGPIGTAAGALIGLLIGALTDVGIAIYQNWDKIKSTVAQKWDDLKSWWSGTVIPAIESIPAKIGNVVDSVVNWFSELPGKIGYALGFAVGTLVQWAKNLYDTVTREVPKIISNVITFFKELPEKISSAIYGAYQSVSDWASGMIQKASEVIPEVIDNFVSFFESIPDRLKALGKNIVDGLYNGVKDAMHLVADKAGELADGFVKGFKDALGIHSPSTVFAEIGDFLMQGLVQGVENAKDYVNTAFNVMGAQAVNAAATGLGLNTGAFNAMGQAAAVQTAEGMNTQVPSTASLFGSAATYFGTTFWTNLDSEWNNVNKAIQTDTIGSIQTLFTAIKDGNLEKIATWSAAYFYHNLNDEQKKQIQTFALTALSQLSTSLSGVFTNLSQLASGFIGMFVPSLATATTAQTGLNIAMDANPVMLVISLIGMLVGALVNFASKNKDVAGFMKKVWYGIGDFMSIIFEGMLRVCAIGIQGFVDAINVLVSAYNAVAWVWDGHADYVSNPFNNWADQVAQKRAENQQQRANADSNANLDASTDQTNYQQMYNELMRQQQETLNSLKEKYNFTTPSYTPSNSNYPSYNPSYPSYTPSNSNYPSYNPSYPPNYPSYNPSDYPGTKEWDKNNNTSSGSYGSSTSVNVNINEEEMRESVYNGTYNAFLDIFQRYGDELTGGKELKIYLDGKQLTASVEKTQNARGRSLMGSEVYSY